ncbi:MAG: LPS-assembly protein LptD [Gemmatimonadota bacterium]
MGRARVSLRLFAVAALVAGTGSYATALAGPAPGGGRPRSDAVLASWSRLAFPADTDTVAVRDTVSRDTIPKSAADSAGARDTVRAAPPGIRDTIPGDSTAVRDTTLVDVAARRAALSSGDFPDRDSVFTRLAGLGSFRIVEYRGREVELDIARERVELHGEAQTNYTSSVLQADSISYRIELQFISAEGDIRLAGADQREVRSDSVLYYDVSRYKGTILDARTVFAARGSQWFVRGNATPKGQRTMYVEAGSFTSCELDEPHYYFKAGKIKVVSENVLVAWPIVLYVHDVPLAWLPFFAQDIRPGRHSGFLPPRFGINDIIRTDKSFNRQISDFGYYFALNPFMDAQFTVDWFSGNYTRLNGQYRYKFVKKFLQGTVGTHYSTGSSGRNFQFQFNHDQQLSPGTNLKVSADFTRNTRLFQDRSFDPRLQTETINSDFGLTHRFSFANMSLSGRRQQFLGDQNGRTDLTLPALNLSFSPVTLFRAPRNRAGIFNNITVSGALTFTRQALLRERQDDVVNTIAGLANSLRLGGLSISSNLNLNDVRTTPFDSVMPQPAFSRTTVRYGTGTSYQVNLMGSTTLRPTIRVDGSAFKSPDTNDQFVSLPKRLSLGASLSTDLYAFLPGFGPFSRIRHRFSPRFNYSYSPAVTIADSLLAIPGFPGGSSKARNSLRVTLSQTFEAKLKPERAARDTTGAAGARPPAGREGAPQTPPGQAGEAVPPREGEAPAPAGGVVEAGAPVSTRVSAPGPPRGAIRPPGRSRQARQDRKLVLLAINSSPLEFDFARAKEGEPVLVTDTWRNSFTSDLLRGLAFNITHDLFDGFGPDRNFSPFLQEVTGSFSFSSAKGLAGIFGLGGSRGPSRAQPGRRLSQNLDSRYRLQGFDNRVDDRFDATQAGAGPWNLSLRYAVRRVRSSQPGRKTETLGADLRLQPTPHWRLQWRTLYSLTNKEFGEQLITLDRDLHHWQASFLFARSPNGNFLFQFRVNLKDAPELKFDYDQQSSPRR